MEDKEFIFRPKESPKNWECDYPHENGMYENICPSCDGSFFGNKHRTVCKECSDENLRKFME